MQPGFNILKKLNLESSQALESWLLRFEYMVLESKVNVTKAILDDNCKPVPVFFSPEMNLVVCIFI